MKKVYISGKITGIEQYAPLLFAEAELTLIEEGFEVVNPTTLKHEHDLTWSSYMKECIKALTDCDMIYMLGNWTDSRGADIERRIAIDLGMTVIYE